MKHEIAMSSVSVSIVPDPMTVGFMNWRPMRELREAGLNLVNGVVGFTNGVIAIVFYLPVLILWFISFVLMSVVLVRVLTIVWKRLRPLYGFRAE